MLGIVNWIVAIIGGTFALTGLSIDNIFKSKIFYPFLAFAMVYFVSIWISQKDLKNKGDILLNSLPINRKDIVEGRYLSIFTYILLITIYIFTISHIATILTKDIFPGATMSGLSLLLVIGLSLIIFSIYLPFQYYNIGKIQVFNQIFYILLIILPTILGRYLDKIMTSRLLIYFMNLNLSLNGIILIILGLGIVLYLISIQVSIIIYKHKEF